MLLSEMVRRIKNEKQLVNDPTERSTTYTTYATVASYNISLSSASLLIYSYEIRNSAGTLYARLKIGDVYVGGESAGTTYTKYGGFFALPAGSHTIEVQLKCYSSGTTSYVKNFLLGSISFPDLSFVALRGAGSSNISLSSRKTCIGLTSKATLIITVHNASAPTVTVDDVTISPVSTSGERYFYCVPATLASHTINVSAGTYSAAMSPWLLSASDSEFVSFIFPQGSTLYIVSEPLWADPTKTIKIGKPRAVSFGGSTDYYSIASGTGILTLSYTFESVEVEQAVLLASGFGGCISIIAVDVRA